ncbi:hypothetical protein GALL_548130 [mine drainage metagenome]|uniref:Uncharacterized protein n=1 Tax=mine drainage metagenome TaxID=410659 RepID=A0A1J5NXZ1_9ZZZZ
MRHPLTRRLAQDQLRLTNSQRDQNVGAQIFMREHPRRNAAVSNLDILGSQPCKHLRAPNPKLVRRHPVHRRRANKSGGKYAGRVCINLCGCADLLHLPRIQQHDPVGH